MIRSVQAFAFAAFAASALWQGAAFAQMGFLGQRHIHLNGNHLSEQQLGQLDNAVGYSVPNGFYWLNSVIGTWGYEGNPEALGSIFREGDPRRVAAGQQHGGDDRADRPYISPDTGTGSAVIGKRCSYVSAGGTTVRVCD